MTISFKDLLVLLTIFQLLIFAVVLFARSKSRWSDQLFLGLFFFSLAVNIFNYFLFQQAHSLFASRTIHLFYLGSPFAFSYAPAFYLYLLFNINRNKKIAAKYTLHFAPFLILMAYIIAFFTLLPLSEKREILMQNGLFSQKVYLLLIISIHLQVLYYALLCLRQVLIFKRHLKNLYSSKDRLNFSWITSMFVAILCLWLLDLGRFLFAFFSEPSKIFFESCLFIGFLIFCYIFLHKAMSSRFFHTDDEPTSGNKKLSLSLPLRKKYEQQLTQHMADKKPFLDPEINLFELSQQVAIPPRSLSEVLNASFQQNFYDFINSYRVKESELLFKSNWEADKTILEILYEVGFNSKSSFNSAFKKLTGITPTEYRRNYRVSHKPRKQVV
jgi:AraC-like DNA-binding protein